MASITAAGTGSGLDIEKIITTLTESERARTDTRLDTREAQVKANISAYSALKGAIKDFKTAISGLATLKNIAARSATSSNTGTFTATASSGAAVGNTSVQVLQLASNHKLVSKSSFASGSAAVGTGTMTLSMGSKSFNVNIVGGQNNTLTGIRDAINSATDNPGITASILTVSNGSGGTESRLVLTADESGASNAITVAVSGDADGNNSDNLGLSQFAFTNATTGNMDEKSVAQDAKLLLDDTYTVNSSSNVFTDVIQGVTITAVSAHPGTNERLTVGLDKTVINQRLTEFVTAFNALSDTMNYLTDYDAETQEAGLLTGDAGARSIEMQIRRTIGNPMEGATGNFTSLASLGITTQRDGKLELNAEKLSSALASNFDDVANLLAGDKGVIKTLNAKLDGFLKSDGVLATRNATFLKQQEEIDEQRVKLDLRMEAYEKSLRKQYSSLDILVGQLQSTGDYVTQQMDVIKAGITGKN